MYVNNIMYVQDIIIVENNNYVIQIICGFCNISFSSKKTHSRQSVNEGKTHLQKG